jgi:aromatic ring-opening dioxygenase catalytic subunit (LigB family)
VNASSEQYFETDYKCGNLVSGRCREGRGEAMMKMPVVFVGHGSPMNAIEDNNYTRGWRKMAERIPKPKVILSVSAHWYTNGTRIMNEENPRTVYDMYGFPKELYEITYNTPGSPEIAKMAKTLISKETKYDNSWGIDHGTWSVLVHMYPDRDIPVFQSIENWASDSRRNAYGKRRNFPSYGVQAVEGVQNSILHLLVYR